MRKGVVLLDLEVTNYIDLCNKIIRAWVENGFILLDDKTEFDEQISFIKDILYAPKFHLIRGKMRRIDETLMNSKIFNKLKFLFF